MLRLLKTTSILLAGFFCLFLASCDNSEKASSTTDEKNMSAMEEEEPTSEPSDNSDRVEEGTKGFDSPAALTSAVLNAMQKQDFETYATYVIPLETLENMAENIEDEQVRKEFKDEMAFSHEEEKDYFVNLSKQLLERGIRLDSIALAEVESFEYANGKYKPLELKEILIDIPMGEFEQDLFVIAIKSNDQWYATSELGM